MMVMAVFWNFGPWKFLQEWFETRNNIFKVKIMYEGQGNPYIMVWKHHDNIGLEWEKYVPLLSHMYIKYAEG